jgi:hypothetical protein
MKQLIILYLLLPKLAFGQDSTVSKIKIEVKPENPKKGYQFDIFKSENEIKIYQKQIDSTAKIIYNKTDLAAMVKYIGLIGSVEKNDGSTGAINADSLYLIKKKMDSINEAYKIYKTDSTTIYKSTHKNYWQFLETIFTAPDEILANKGAASPINGETYCFFTIVENRTLPDRYLFIDSLDPKKYPLLVKLLNDTDAIMRAHRAVMEKKN